MALGVHNGDGAEHQLPAAVIHLGTVGGDAQGGRRAEGILPLPGDLIAPVVVANGLDVAGGIGNLPAGQIVRPAPQAAPALAPAVYDQLHLGQVGQNAHIDHLAGVKVPVGQQVQHGLFLPGVPACLIGVEIILGKPGGIHQAKIAVLGVIGRRLADVVNAAPQELSQLIGVQLVGGDAGLVALRAPAGAAVAQAGALLIVVHQQRLGQGEVIDAPALNHRGGLAAVDHPAGIFFMVLVVQAFAVVVAHHVQQGSAVLGILPGHVVGAEGGQAVPPGVMAEHLPAQGLGGVVALLGVPVGVVDLIADAPHDEAGVVPIPAYPAGHILLEPLGEEAGIVIGRLAAQPHVKGLVDHHNAQLVRQLHHGGGGHVVRGAQGVHAHVLHDFQLPPGGGAVEGRAQAAQVVMQAHAVEHQTPVIQEQSLIRENLHRAEATGLRQLVQSFAAAQEPRPKPVAAGCIHRPEPGILYREYRLFGAGRSHGGNRFPRRRQQGIFYHVGGQGIFRLRRYRDLPFALAQLPGGDIQPIGDQVGVVILDAPHVPVDTRAGIPAGVGVAQQAAHQDGIFAGVQIIRHVHLEGGIAILPLQRQLPVDVHRRIHIHALKVQAEAAAGGVGKALAVPAGAVLIQIAYMPDLPVVGQRHRLPAKRPGRERFTALRVDVAFPISVPKGFCSHIRCSFHQKKRLPGAAAEGYFFADEASALEY